MATLDEKNNLAYLLHKELLKTAEKFARKCPNAGADVLLGAGCAYIVGFITNAPTKRDAGVTLESCFESMDAMLDATPDEMFGRNRRNANLN